MSDVPEPPTEPGADPTTGRPPTRDLSQAGPIVAGIGAAALAIACCAGPALLTAGALGGIGALLGSPWVIGAALAALVIAAAAVHHRRHSRSHSRRTSPGLTGHDNLGHDNLGHRDRS